MKTIGIDLGTTTISMVVMDLEKKQIIDVITVPHEGFLPSHEDWERIQDPDMLIGTASRLLNELLVQHTDVQAIGLTGQMHGILYTDKNGSAISPLYTWQDKRGDFSENMELSLSGQISDRYSLSVSTGYGLITHLYNLSHNLVPAAATSLCTIGDYLGMVLTDRKAPLLHTSNAASLGFFDCMKLRFYTDILKKEGMDLSLLPDVTSELSVLGTYQNIPVTVCLGDNQASFLGSVGFSPDTVLLNMGTGGQISVLSDSFLQAPGIEARPYLKGKYLLVGASLCGGRSYAILEKFLRSYLLAAVGNAEEQYDIMSILAQKGEQCSDPMSVSTTFHGTRQNPELRGSISNLSEDNFTPESMIYGVLHGMADELFQLYRIITDKTTFKAAHLIASGNALRKNDVLQRIFSRMFHSPLTLAPYQEEAACGAAISSTFIN